MPSAQKTTSEKMYANIYRELISFVGGVSLICVRLRVIFQTDHKPLYVNH